MHRGKTVKLSKKKLKKISSQNRATFEDPNARQSSSKVLNLEEEKKESLREFGEEDELKLKIVSC